MRQTETYKLNLIDPSDPFLPDGLNQNTQKLEDVLHENLEDMDQRVTVLEGRKIYFGSFHNTTGARPFHVDLPFTPAAVFVLDAWTQGHPLLSTATQYGVNPALVLTENGFDVSTSAKCAFIAFC